MANAMALINEGLWRKDRDFQRLPRSAQCTYCQLLSQKDLDTAGGLTLHIELMAKACDELTVEQLKADLALLEERRFVFVDYQTDELLVRSYVRLVSAVGAPKNRAWLSVPKNARMIGSVKLRHELAVELRRLRTKEANELADEIDPTPTQPPSDPLPTPSKNEGGSNPPSTSQVLDLVSPSVVGSVGEEPSPFCHLHPNGTDKGCFACGQAKRTHPDRLQAWKDARAKRVRDVITACLLCDEDGWAPDEERAPTIRCTHPNLDGNEQAHA